MKNGPILVVIKYPIDVIKTPTIETNAKTEALKEILTGFLRTQIGLGKDKSSPNKEYYYTITISLQLEGDVFTVKSDTGNKGLTTGIVMDVLKNLGKIEVKNLE